MRVFYLKPGDSVTIHGVACRVCPDATKEGGLRLSIQAPEGVPITHNGVPVSSGALSDGTEMQMLVEKIVDEIAQSDPDSDGYIGAFVSALCTQILAAVRQRERETVRRRQRRGIAAAKERGVHFGAQAKSLPERFDEARQAWRSGGLSLREAADICDMPKTSFYNAVLRLEKTAEEQQEHPGRQADSHVTA